MRTHYCGELSISNINEDVELCGWVHRRRDHGGVIFVELRDRTGRVQVVVDPENPEQFNKAESLRSEYVLRVRGYVRARPEGTENSEMLTGKIEVYGDDVEILNSSDPLPFQLEDSDTSEPVRLRHRYLDLRTDRMQSNLRLRHHLFSQIRKFLELRDFTDVETPILTQSTPEGARDYLVPSRVYPGSFFALPQSPQIFKQLLMVSGLEKYYQIARCFRDEDLRADRQPEFTQLDIEMSFVNEEDVMALSEEMIRSVFKSVLDTDLPSPFPRLSYQDAISRYGSDRPDLRIDTELVEISDLMRKVEFKVFSEPANADDSRVVALRVPQASDLTRQQIDGYTNYVSQFGARGLAYIKVNNIDSHREGLQSPILKFLDDDAINGLMERTGVKNGDLIFFGADKETIVNDAMGALRVRLGHDLKNVEEKWKPLWIVDFPLMAFDAATSSWHSEHHPFTSPIDADIQFLKQNPGVVRAQAYDMVLNGAEIGGGSIRVHRSELQKQIFEVLGINEEKAREKFGFLLDALKYGAPPHGGIAFGLDRLASIMCRENSIREVIAFPKTQKSACLMTDAPSAIDKEQLNELGISIQSELSNLEK
tara:strand:+ start:36604 stop:38388 length:1785 start_codon:yes stop_codon:yes gene_type:complete